MELSDVDEVEANNQVNWDPVLEALAAGNVSPGQGYKIVSLTIIALKASPDLLLSQSTFRRRIHEMYSKNG